eukprot:gb/GECG01009824.1/.p1 GENE.gb/GECG01009824.1/~~gb/GECG01009824.1/.p1  ORF type:complete len:233 (+),score=18.06 gb/GECG01009824.1/:1-699(+)
MEQLKYGTPIAGELTCVFLPQCLVVILFVCSICLDTIREHEEWVRCIAINTSGTLLASGSQDHTVKIHDLNSNQVVCDFADHEHVVESVVFSNEQQSQRLRDAIRRKNSKESAMNSGQAISAAALEASGDFLLTASRDCSIRCYDIAKKECIAVLKGHENWVRKALFHPCGHLVVSVAEDKTLSVWDVCEQKRVRELKDAHSHFISALDVHPRQPLIATGGVDSLIRLWGCK